MTVSVLWLFLTVPWVGLQCVIVVFPDHTPLLSVIGILMVKIIPSRPQSDREQYADKLFNDKK